VWIGSSACLSVFFISKQKVILSGNTTIQCILKTESSKLKPPHSGIQAGAGAAGAVACFVRAKVISQPINHRKPIVSQHEEPSIAYSWCFVVAVGVPIH
jgi:hypothetical protein